MKRREAIAVISLATAMTLTACNKTDVVTEQPVEMTTEETTAEDAELTEDVVETEEKAETYKVEFKYAQNEEINAKVDEKVTVPEYEDTILLDTYYGSDYFSIESDSYYAENFETISAEEHEDGSATIIAKGTTTEATYGMVTRYSYDGTDMKAIFCYEPYGVEIEAEDFGLNFVIERDAEGNYEIVGLQDLAGNDCSDIIFYYGDVIGWSLTENATECDFEFGDEIYLSQDLVLYPVVKDMVDPDMETVDLSSGLWIKSFAGKAVQYSKTGKGKTSENGWYSKSGKVVNEDGSKEYNPESGEVEDSTPSDTDPSNPSNPSNPNKPDGKKPSGGNTGGNGGTGGNTTPGGGNGGGTGGNTPTSENPGGTENNNPAANPWGAPTSSGDGGMSESWSDVHW